MRILLKNCEGEFVKAGDGWTENETEARHFGSMQQALDFRQSHPGLIMILRFPDPKFDREVADLCPL
jgi:hypothetical protein